MLRIQEMLENQFFIEKKNILREPCWAYSLVVFRHLGGKKPFFFKAGINYCCGWISLN